MLNDVSSSWPWPRGETHAWSNAQQDTLFCSLLPSGQAPGSGIANQVEVLAFPVHAGRQRTGKAAFAAFPSPDATGLISRSASKRSDLWAYALQPQEPRCPQFEHLMHPSTLCSA